MQDTPGDNTPGPDPLGGPPAPPPPPAAAHPGGTKPLVARARDLLSQPKAEWAVIDNEPATIGSLYTSYVMILAAIPPIATALGLILFLPRGYIYGVMIGLSTGSIIAGAIVQYLLGLASVYIMALIIDALAPTFGSQKNQLKAFKVAAYYPTAAWLAGIVMIIPYLGILALVGGIYSLYLLFVGLPILMKTPQDKAVGYFVTVLVVAIVVFMVIGTISNRIVYGGMF
jgi:hypothetical protein